MDSLYTFFSGRNLQFLKKKTFSKNNFTPPDFSTFILNDVKILFPSSTSRIIENYKGSIGFINLGEGTKSIDFFWK